MTPSNDSVTTPGTRTPATSGRTPSVIGVEKEKWETFSKTWGTSGDEGEGQIGRKVDYGLGIANDVAGLSCWGFRVGTEVS
jgi:hypothetical protein